MFFSIITVTYKAELTIKETLESIKSQSCADYELIVIDGLSNDRTMDIVHELCNSLDSFKCISEPDRGIYDAMNKGVKLASGEYIYFLNSGDKFVNEDVLSEVKEYIKSCEKNKKYIFQGNIIRNGKRKIYPDKFKKWKWVYLEHAYFSHQGIFASKETFENNMFDISLRVCADREWLICAMEAGTTYNCMNNIDVAYYAEGGASCGYKNQQAESLEISRRHGGALAYYFVKFKRIIGVFLGHER